MHPHKFFVIRNVKENKAPSHRIGLQSPCVNVAEDYILRAFK